MSFIRTGKTNLSDDELMLFDAIFDSWCSKTALTKEKFAIRFNFPYKHALSEKKLSQTLLNLQERKLIKSKKELFVRKSQGIKEKRDYFSLTREGGRLWSLERKPDWKRYCVNSESFELEVSNIKVISPSRETLDEVVKLNHDFLYENLGISIEATVKTLENYYLIPWKLFSKVYSTIWLEPFCLMPKIEWSNNSDLRKKTNSWATINDLLGKLL